MKIIITGPPQAGKSTLASVLSRVLDIPVRSTDELKDLEWSEASRVAARWLDEPGSWIIEGVTVPRAIRKWRAATPDALPPFDKAIILRNPRIPLELSGQKAMATTTLGLMDTFKDWIGKRWVEL